MEMIDRSEGSASYNNVGGGHVNHSLDTGDYLHPAETAVTPTKYVKPRDPGNMRGPRFDSGVADLDAVNVEVAKQHKDSKLRHNSLAKNYDYADYGGHQYEELPNSRVKPLSPSSEKSDQQSSAGTVTVGTPSDSGDTTAIVRNGENRKRFNPLYDTMINSTPSIYNKVKATRESHSQKQLRLLKIIVIIFIFISCVSLAISLYLVTVYTKGPVMVENLQQELDSLQVNHTALSQKMKMLETLVSGNSSLEHLVELSNQVAVMETKTLEKIDALEKNLNGAKTLISRNDRKIDSVYHNASMWINSTEQDLIFIQNNFTFTLDLLHQGIKEQLNVIKKMPGPQGPPGVGNLTACYMKIYTSESATSRDETVTVWAPDSDTLNTNIIMFAFCEVRGGLTQNLETQQVGDNRYYQYRCHCTGTQQGSTDRRCRSHLWMCPRESFGGAS